MKYSLGEICSFLAHFMQIMHAVQHTHAKPVAHVHSQLWVCSEDPGFVIPIIKVAEYFEMRGRNKLQNLL